MKTPQDQVRGGREEGIAPNTELYVNSTGEHYLSTNQHLPVGVGHQREGVVKCPHEFGWFHTLWGGRSPCDVHPVKLHHKTHDKQKVR